MNDLRLIGIGMNMLLGMLLMACSSIPVRKAEEVVSQADSLWHEGKMYGIDEGDSATLAQAYETLNSFVHRTSSLGTFSHACYHYGKLLRAKDNPAEAMQVFINATHSHTKDYHILGRVYSNMGSICHLAGEFSLSYDMYEKSAQVFLQGGDSLSYYILLNDMAYELAEQGKEEETYAIIRDIEKHCSYPQVEEKSHEVKAILFRSIEQYDSAIYYVNKIQRYSMYPVITLIKAQAYDNLGIKDSALVLANLVLTDPRSSYQNKFNALYIIQHCDSSLCADSISEIASQREDIRYYEYEPEKEKLNKAVNLLIAEIDKQPDFSWLYAVAVTILVIGTLTLLYILRKRRQHQLLSQQVDDLNAKNIDIKQQHEQIVQKHTEYTNNLIYQIEQNCTIISQSRDFPNNIRIKEFNAMCKIVDSNFNMLASKLCHLGILNETEIRLCILVFLNANRGQISDFLPYAKNGIGKLKYRVSQKMGIDAKSLRKSLITMAINEPFEKE